MQLREANLLSATEDYIVQQCCCTGCRPQGLSAAISVAFPHGNPYKACKPIKKRGNTAIPEDRVTPGTVQILGNGKDERYIGCLFAQYAMGKPGVYDSFGTPDTAADRERYFLQALEALAAQIPLTASLAFPYKIGCGLAGGNWQVYQKILKDWAASNPGFRVVIYKID